MRPPHPSQPPRPLSAGPGAGNSGPFAAPPREHREKTRLTFTVFGDRLACTVAQETLSHKCLVPYDAERVAEATRTIVGTLARGNRARTLSDANLRDLQGAGEELWRMLIPEPVRDDLEGHDGSPLLLELDDALVPVPWELIYDGNQFLCRRFEIGRAVSTSQPSRAAPARKITTPPAKLLVVLSNPRGDLPDVDAEGPAILEELEGHSQVKARLVVGRNVDYVRRELKDFDLIHYAGHADHVPHDPEASGWHLSDGKLPAREIANLAGGRPMPLLVFSNACQSSHAGIPAIAAGPADARSVFGLANAFLVSGVKYYIGTQWEVVDGASRTFARAFWAALVRGHSVGGAVRRARERVLTQDGESDLGWASYVLYGDPEFVPIPPELAHVEAPVPTPADLAMRQSIRRKAPVGALARANQAHHDSGGWTQPVDRPERDRSGPQPTQRRRRMSDRTASLLWLAVGAVGMAATLVIAWLIYNAMK